MHYAICAGISLAFGNCAVLYRDKRYADDRKLNWKRAVTGHKKFFISFLTVFFLVAIAGCALDSHAPIPNRLLLYKSLLLFYGTALIAYTDYREHLIPNKLVLVLLAIRLGFFVYESIAIYHELRMVADCLRVVFVGPLLGALISAGILAIAMLVSRKGVGMGDVKLFAVIGLFVGSAQIIPFMLLTFAFSALAGIVLLIARKVRMKDSLPMAPFAAVGILLHFFWIEGGYLL